MIKIIMSPSLCGKDTVLKMMVSDYGYNPIVSITSRPKRPHETDGIEYYFKTKEEFLELIEDNKLIEHRTYNTTVDGVDDTWYYGLLKQEFDDNKDYVLILDVQGTKDFIDYVGLDKCKIYMLYVPDELLEKRAKCRSGYDEIEYLRRKKADSNDFSVENMIDVLGKECYNSINSISNYEIIVAGTNQFGATIFVPCETDINKVVERIVND